MGDVDVNLPGLHTPHMQFKIPFFQKIFKEEYRIHITGMVYDFGHLCIFPVKSEPLVKGMSLIFSYSFIDARWL
jgi:hypothetical protein